ncbi:sensor histidine kinase [Paenibacillus sp. IB182363]|uniref:histidine kinase n=1 Tax=Paenibacillus oceani TaxID=2772510 RepID=A0A927CDB3_9BACL|nr:sensor histidine kinase [Paenibacillus oceani]
MERSLNNLLGNAVRHTPEFGEIVVQGYTENGQVKFTIRDTGPGFSSEELQRAFEPLFRGERVRACNLAYDHEASRRRPCRKQPSGGRRSGDGLASCKRPTAGQG